MADHSSIGRRPRKLFTAAGAARASGWSYWHVRELARLGEAPVAAIVGRNAPLFDEAGVEWLRERRRERGALPALGSE